MPKHPGRHYNQNFFSQHQNQQEKIGVLSTTVSIEAIHDILAGRQWEEARLPVAEIPFAPELLSACKANTCGHYNKSWTCPPALDPELEARRIRSFQWAFIFTTKHDLEDSFDFEGMEQGRISHRLISEALYERFGSGNPVYGPGGCSCCGTCAYPAPCRFPKKAFPSLEGAGVYVSALSKKAGIRYNNGPNTVTYFSMLLFNKASEL